MSESADRELQTQLREMKERIIGRLNEMETKLQFRINLALQCINSPPRVVNNDDRICLDCEPVVRRDFPFDLSPNGNYRNLMDIMQNVNAVVGTNPPMVRRHAGTINNIMGIQNVFLSGVLNTEMGSPALRPFEVVVDGLEEAEREARQRRQAAQYEDDDSSD